MHAVTGLAYLAGVTSRIRLASNISILALQHPVVQAKQWAVLDWLSGGRADLMAEFARAAIGKCDVVAESLGGWAALWLAVRHPDLVEHLVLQGPAGLRDEGTGGLPADPEGRLRALFAHPERAPPETRSAQEIAASQQARGRCCRTPARCSQSRSCSRS